MEWSPAARVLFGAAIVVLLGLAGTVMRLLSRLQRLEQVHDEQTGEAVRPAPILQRAAASGQYTLSLAAVGCLVGVSAVAMYFVHRTIGLHASYWMVPVFGALGGLTGSLIRDSNSLSLVYLDPAKREVHLGFVGDMILGLGGATAIVFLFDNTLKFDPNKPESYPLMASLCFIAGAFGQRVIESAGEKLAKDAMKVAKDAQGQAEDLRANQASAFVIASLYKYDHGLFDEALKAAEQALELAPSDVPAIIAKARALKRLGRVKEALDITEAALKRPVSQVGGPDYGALLYNSLCYKLLLQQVSADEAIKLLRDAITLRPELRANAPTDQDLKALWDNSAFLQLTGAKSTLNDSGAGAAPSGASKDQGPAKEPGQSLGKDGGPVQH